MQASSNMEKENYPTASIGNSYVRQQVDRQVGSTHPSNDGFKNNEDPSSTGLMNDSMDGSGSLDDFSCHGSDGELNNDYSIGSLADQNIKSLNDSESLDDFSCHGSDGELNKDSIGELADRNIESSNDCYGDNLVDESKKRFPDRAPMDETNKILSTQSIHDFVHQFFSLLDLTSCQWNRPYLNSTFVADPFRLCQFYDNFSQADCLKNLSCICFLQTMKLLSVVQAFHDESAGQGWGLKKSGRKQSFTINNWLVGLNQCWSLIGSGFDVHKNSSIAVLSFIIKRLKNTDTAETNDIGHGKKGDMRGSFDVDKDFQTYEKFCSMENHTNQCKIYNNWCF